MRGLIAVLMVFLIAGCGSSARTATATISTVPIAEWTVPASAEFLPLPDPASKVDVTFNVEERYNYSQRNSAQRDTVAILRKAKSDFPGRPVLVRRRVHQRLEAAEQFGFDFFTINRVRRLSLRLFGQHSGVGHLRRLIPRTAPTMERCAEPGGLVERLRDHRLQGGPTTPAHRRFRGRLLREMFDQLQQLIRGQQRVAVVTDRAAQPPLDVQAAGTEVTRYLPRPHPPHR